VRSPTQVILSGVREAKNLAPPHNPQRPPSTIRASPLSPDFPQPSPTIPLDFQNHRPRPGHSPQPNQAIPSRPHSSHSERSLTQVIPSGPPKPISLPATKSHPSHSERSLRSEESRTASTTRNDHPQPLLRSLLTFPSSPTTPLDLQNYRPPVHKVLCTGTTSGRITQCQDNYREKSRS
jgi:hypothetical protein